jgi:two-component system chemotaxis response regulator CheY
MARILVVDDDPSTRNLLKRTLESTPDTDVIEAEDGAQGLDRAQDSRPDLILLDIMMPKMSGIDFLEVRMGSDELSRIPVVVISVLGERSHVVAAVSRGACGYVTKPFDPRGLQSKVADLLRSRARA